MEHFIDEVTKWQKLLNHAETVLYDWLDVQGKWSSLEAIFLGSKDIRVQLPEDSARFDEIDAEWKALMANAQNTPNVIEACSTHSRSEKLQSMKVGLGAVREVACSSTWRPSARPSRASTSSATPRCWTSSRRATTRRRCRNI